MMTETSFLEIQTHLAKARQPLGTTLQVLCVHSFPGEMSILNILYEANFRCLLYKLTWIIHTCHIKYQHGIKHPVHKIVLELPYIWWSIHCLLSIYSKPGTFIDATHSEVEAEKKKLTKNPYVWDELREHYQLLNTLKEHSYKLWRRASF